MVGRTLCILSNVIDYGMLAQLYVPEPYHFTNFYLGSRPCYIGQREDGKLILLFLDPLFLDPHHCPRRSLPPESRTLMRASTIPTLNALTRCILTIQRSQIRPRSHPSASGAATYPPTKCILHHCNHSRYHVNELVCA